MSIQAGCASLSAARKSAFDNVNSGRVRVLIGSTEKCGAGTNVQKRLVALHHLDTPYRPSDMEQREGRIIRQGNTNDKVQIFTYVTERTFDSYSYQILENKQRFISQINKGDLTVTDKQGGSDRKRSRGHRRNDTLLCGNKGNHGSQSQDKAENGS